MKSGSSIDTLLLDLDGTLIDSLPGIEYSVHRAMELCNASLLRSDFRALVGPPIRDILATVSGRTNPREVDALERAFRCVYDGGAWQRATLFPEVHSTLHALVDAGARLFVVTNKPRVPAERILSHLGISPLLTALRSPDQCQPSYKTKAEAVEGLRADFALNCEHTLMVGDALDDAQAAATFGCRFAGVDFGYGAACSQTECPLHFRIKRFGELISIVTGNISATHTHQPIPTL